MDLTSQSILPRAALQGVEDGLMSGAVMGYPVFNAAVTIHPDMCFVAGTATTPAAMRAAAASATTRAVRDAAPVMLEPHMTVVVSVHERSVGDVLNDLTSQRRARIQEVAPTNLPGRSNVIASVPLAEMIGTATRVSWRVVVEVWELTHAGACLLYRVCDITTLHDGRGRQLLYGLCIV